MTHESAGDVADHTDDAYLVARAQEGYADAYELLLRRHRDGVYRVALRMLGDRSDAEDVAQEALLRAWRGLDRFRGDAPFAAWLYRITINSCRSLRQRRQLHLPLDPAHEAPGPSADEAVVQHARLAALAGAIATLPDDQRAVLVLHQFEGASYEEVATILSLPEPTVRGRLVRARRSLASALKEWA